MATIFFVLKEPRSPNETTILAKYKSSLRSFKLSTTKKIHPSKWNQEKQLARNNFEGAKDLNDFLKKFKSIFEKIENKTLAIGEGIGPEIFKNSTELNVLLQKKEKNSNEVTVLIALDEFISIKKNTLSFNYMRSVNTFKNHLKNFSKVAKVKLEFEKIDLAFYEKFVSYLYQIGQTDNTVGTNIARLKYFLDWANKRKINKFNFYKEKEFKAIKKEMDFIYLTEEELFRIYELDLSNSPRLNNVRDSFCFGCFTGLRFSDLQKLRPENVKGDELHITIQKTRVTMMIPLNIFAREIIERNGMQLSVFSNQKMNDYIKEIGELAEINDLIKVVKFSGAKRIETTQEKFKLIATHTARRTFITLSLERGMRPESLMKTTGHKSMKHFMRYVTVTDKVKKIELQRVWKREPEPILKVV